MELEEYQLCGKYIDPVHNYELLRFSRESSLRSAKNHPSLDNDEHYQWIDKRYLGGVNHLLKILTALQRTKEKQAVLQRASNYFGYEQISKW